MIKNQITCTFIMNNMYRTQRFLIFINTAKNTFVLKMTKKTYWLNLQEKSKSRTASVDHGEECD